MENTIPTLSVLTCSYCGEKKKGCMVLFGTNKLICSDCIKKEKKYDGSKTQKTHSKL